MSQDHIDPDLSIKSSFAERSLDFLGRHILEFAFITIGSLTFSFGIMSRGFAARDVAEMPETEAVSKAHRYGERSVNNLGEMLKGAGDGIDDVLTNSPDRHVEPPSREQNLTDGQWLMHEVEDLLKEPAPTPGPER